MKLKQSIAKTHALVETLSNCFGNNSANMWQSHKNLFVIVTSHGISKDGMAARRVQRTYLLSLKYFCI